MLKALFVFLLTLNTFAIEEKLDKPNVKLAYKDYINASTDYENELKSTINLFVKYRNFKISQTFQQRISEVEKGLKLKSRENIVSIENYLRKSKADEIYMDDALLMRLAQMYFQSANYVFNERMSNYESELKLFYNGKTKKAPDMPAPDFTKSLTYSQKLLESFPKSPYADSAHYLAAYITEESGQFDKSIGLYKSFVFNYPYSKYRDEVLWRLSELYFDIQNYSQAQKYYKMLVDNSKSEFYYKAEYKLGALNYLQKKYSSSATGFVRLVKSLDIKPLRTPADETLYGEALEYLGLLELRGVKLKFNKKIRKLATNKLIERLERYREYKWARNVYGSYIKKYYFDPSIPIMYEALVQSFEQDGLYNDAEKVRLALNKHLSPNSKWRKKNNKRIQTMFAATDVFESSLLDSARFNAQKAIKSGKRQNLMIAVNYYKKFIKNYKYSEYAPMAAYEMGQLYFQIGKYTPASKAFRFALKNGLPEEEADAAAYANFLSLFKDATGKESIEYKAQFDSKGNLLKPLDKTKKDLMLLKAKDLYIKYSQSPKQENQVKSLLAGYFFNKNRFEEAQELLSSVISESNNANTENYEPILNSAILLADIYDYQGNYEKVKQTNEIIDNLKSISGEEKLESVKWSGDRILYRAGRQESSQNFAAAAQSYSDFLLASNDDNNNQDVILRAALMYRKANDYIRSQEMLNRLTSKSYLAEKLYILGRNFNDLADIQKSNQALETYVKLFPSHKWHSYALDTLVVNYELLNQWAKLNNLFNNYALSFSDKKYGNRIVAAAVETGNLVKLKSFSIKYRNPSLSLQANAGFADYYYKKNNISESLKYCKKVNKKYKTIKVVSYENLKAFVNCEYIANIFSSKMKTPEKIKSWKEEAEKLDKKGFGDVAAKYWFRIAELYEKSDKRKTAVKYYYKTIKSLEYSSESDLGKIAYNKMRENKYPQVPYNYLVNWDIYKKSVVEWPSNLENLKSWDYVMSICKSGELNRCKESLENIYAESTSDQSLLALVKLNLILGDDKNAMKWYQSYAEKLSWNNASVALGLKLGFDLKIPQESYLNFTNKGLSDYEFNLVSGLINLKKKNVKLAQEFLLKAIQSEPTELQAYIVLASMNYQMENYKYSKYILRQANSLSSKSYAANTILNSFEKLVLNDKKVENVNEYSIYSDIQKQLLSRLKIDALPNELNESSKQQLGILSKLVGIKSLERNIASEKYENSHSTFLNGAYLLKIGKNNLANQRFEEAKNYGSLNPYVLKEKL